MAEIIMSVDTALGEVPVNIAPLVDSSDFTIEESVVYNQGGMDLNWNFVDKDGVFTQTNVVPTSGGAHDWTNQGNGMYTLEIPASGGTVDNDAEGFGWFTGMATGILPWRGPIIHFAPANIVDSLVDASDKLQVDAVEVNSTALTGDGSATPWGPA